MAPQLDVSIVIPAFNVVESLPACLHAIDAQTIGRDRYEVIVVDNNSTDGSVALARGWPGVTLAKEPRQGAYSARNHGADLANGRALAFVDSDCVPEPRWLEAALAALEDGAVVVVGNTLPGAGSRALSLLQTAMQVRDEYGFAGTDPELYYAGAGNMAVSRSAFEEVGPFAERARGADVLFVRAALARYGMGRIVFEPLMRVRHAEVGGLRAYLHKLHVYGYAAHGYRDAAAVGQPRLPERARLLLRACRLSGGRTALPALVLLGLAARWSWRLGRWRAALGLGPPGGARTRAV
jgi:glycosyltransferase involved in cell wall biosynthesis